ncbi:MAG: SRPBCC domain-containing protein [Myxococcales bacterium]|nr:SRPBCC domain-containing protein [Myxococcales bacterium]
MPSILTTLVIDAPHEKVWSVLADFASYDAWNPLVRRVRGRAEVGAALDFQLQVGPIRAPIDARVVRADGRELRWEGPRRRALSPLGRGSHYFRLEPATEGRTRLVHGEDFGGPLFALPWPLLGPRLEAGYAALNRALADEVRRRARAS